DRRGDQDRLDLRVVQQVLVASGGLDRRILPREALEALAVEATHALDRDVLFLRKSAQQIGAPIAETDQSDGQLPVSTPRASVQLSRASAVTSAARRASSWPSSANIGSESSRAAQSRETGAPPSTTRHPSNGGWSGTAGL